MVDPNHPLFSVLLTTGTVFKVAVPQNIKHYLLKELVNLYSKLDKNLGARAVDSGKSAEQRLQCQVKKQGMERMINYIVKLIVVSGLLCKNGVGVFKCLSHYGI